MRLNDNVYDNFPTLSSPRITLRELELNDAPDIHFLRSDSRVLQYLDAEPQTDVSQALDKIQLWQKDFENKTLLNWGITLHGSHQLIGNCCFWNIDTKNDRAELGYALKPNYWRQGIMKEALNLIIPFGFTTYRLHSIKANVNPHNIASIKVLTSLGFRKEAHFREDYFYKDKYVDSAIYCLLESDWL